MTFKSYQEIFGRKEDFKIKYRYYTPEEGIGGKEYPPHQHIRNDFWYDHGENKPNSVFMIYPEFIDNKGNTIKEGRVERSGIAKMWILMPEMFEYHKAHIKVGQKGYFHEGVRKTGECEIIEIVGLNDL